MHSTGVTLNNLRGDIIGNTSLYFKCKGDGSELFEHNLPTPHYYHRQNNDIYAIGWLISGYFHTGKGIAYINDIIARLSLSLPISEKLSHSPNYQNAEPLKLKAFQNAISLRTEYAKQATKHENNLSRDMVWWSIKFQAESLIRQFGGWFNYQILEDWTLNVFMDEKKDKSTLKAKCRGTWYWYEEREFTIPERKGSIMSREEAGVNAATKNAAAKKAKVIGAIEALKFLQEKINIANVAKQAQVSRPTAKKYLEELKLINKESK